MKLLYRTIAVVLVVLLCMGMLSGCDTTEILAGFDQANLMRPPGLTGSQKGIQDALEASLGNKSYTLKYPATGKGAQGSAFIPVDFGTNGSVVLAFYVLDNAESNKILINVMKAEESGEYTYIEDISGPYSEIYSVEQSDLDGDGIKEIIICWTVSSSVDKHVTVYSFDGSALKERFKRDYTALQVADLEGDSASELVILEYKDEVIDDTAKKSATAYIYRFSGLKEGEEYAEDQINMDATIEPRTATASPYLEVKTGELRSGVNAVFVDAAKGSENTITEVLYWDEERGFCNLFYSEDSKGVKETLRNTSVLSTDINKDGWIEIPKVQVMPGYESKQTTAEKLWLVTWYRYDGRYDENQVDAEKVFTCSINTTEGYYFIFDDEWIGGVTILRNTSDRTSEIYAWEAGESGEYSRTKLLATIRVFTKAKWEERGSATIGYQVLTSYGNRTYAVRTTEAGEAYGMNWEKISSNFVLIAK